MTSRTTPVGIFVLALAGIFTMGCNAQTGAVFDALLDPGTAVVSASEDEPAADATAEGTASATWWPLPEGYQMTLPPGWSGVELDRAGTARVLSAMGASHPALVERVEGVLGDTRSRVSAVAGDPTQTGELVPVLLVLSQPTDGRKPHEIKQHIRRQIAQLPGISAKPIVQDASLTAARGWRFDYSIDDPDLGELRVRSYLFRYGRDAYLVNFVASESAADDLDALFDEIAESLRFGI